MLSSLLAMCLVFGACGGSGESASAGDALAATSSATGDAVAVSFESIDTPTSGAIAANTAGGGSPGSAVAPAPLAAPPVLPDGSLAWSHPATWGGTLPPTGAEVVIPAGKVITLDMSPPNLAGLRIEGTLRFARKDVTLTTGFIDLTGTLEIGTPAARFAQRATITLTGQPQAVNDGASRGLIVRGGRIDIYGTPPSPAWTKLNDNANAGATALTLKESVDWKAGDTIAIAPTDFYGVAATERLPLAAVAGNKLTLRAPLAKFRWGKLQYVTNTGMSLTPDPSYVPPALPAPTELDERAAVGNLSRNIVIQGADDAAWRNDGFGAHVMVMNLASKIVIDGVEFRRVGQAGVTGRYPFHWHLLSYAPDGQLMGDAIGHVLRNSSIWNSANRCVVIHGTNGVQVLNNICQDIKGHAFFLEDAVERRNVLEGNLALMTRSPDKNQLLQVHEGSLYQGGPSGFWLTNPDNTVRNNVAGDAFGNGFWMAFPRKPLGLSANVPILPDRTPHGVFENNTAHTARGPGVLLEWVPKDAEGNVVGNKYVPTKDGAEDTYSNRLRFSLKRITSFKNLDGAYRNRVSTPDYLEWVTADSVGTHFAGAGDDGVIARSLLVGTSLNNETPFPTLWYSEPPSAFASYHSTFNMRDNTVVNFPFVEGKPSGAFKTNDYYTSAVDKGTVRNPNNRLIASDAGYRTLPPNMDGQPLANRNWTYAGALWDPHGYWGPKENFFVYDVPFLTAGAACQWALPAGKNGKTCAGQYYGVGGFSTDFDDTPYMFKSPIDVARLDAAGSEIGRWAVADGATSTILPNMRHFAARPGGIYVLRFPAKPLPKRFGMNVTNAFRIDDSFVFAVAFDGAVNARGYVAAGHREQPQAWAENDPSQQFVRWFKPASGIDEVINSAGDKIWQDRANNLVWIRFRGGLPFPSAASLVANSDRDLYRTYGVSIYSAP